MATSPKEKDCSMPQHIGNKIGNNYTYMENSDLILQYLFEKPRINIQMSHYFPLGEDEYDKMNVP